MSEAFRKTRDVPTMILLRLSSSSLPKLRGSVTHVQFRGHATAQITSHDELSTIIKQFPPQIGYTFGYGSAVLRQQNSNPSSSMVDIIMAVSDPYQWHAENLVRHPDHYSVMSRLGGPSFVTWLQTSFGAKLYFHPYIDLNIRGSTETRQIKYGVVSTSDLVSDLLCWDHLYLAGRMHKPICQIQTIEYEDHDGNKAAKETKRTVDDAQRVNLLAAVSSSLLLLGGKSRQSSLTILSTSELYTTIASLSYTGDFRMQTGAEDPNKITKLVDTPGMLDLWEFKYADTLKTLEEIGLLSMTFDNAEEKKIELNTSDVQTRKQLMTYLPARLQTYSDSIIGLDGHSNIHQGSIVLKDQLAKIVAPAARNQGIKGIFTAGPIKSWKYALAKFAKGRLKT